MTLEEMLIFKGRPKDLEEYSRLLKRKDRLLGEIGRLSNKILAEDDSISVFVGELSQRDKERLQRHIQERDNLSLLRAQKQRLLDLTLDKISEMQK